MRNWRVSALLLTAIGCGLAGIALLVSHRGYLRRNNEKPAASALLSRTEPNTMLIEPIVLEEKLAQPELQVLDTRPQTEFAKNHIPGAVHVDGKKWQELGKKDGGFRDADAWAALVGELGIGNDTHVVVYGSSLPDTARIWWTLKYLGLEHVGILNGGWAAWTREGRTSSDASPMVQPVAFKPKFQGDRLEEIDSLKQSVQAGDVTVVDARSLGEFSGKEVRGKRGGRIPGAKHLEWKELLEEDGRFKSRDELRELFQKRGIMPDQTAITC
jgi:thiosulfate/3-mercaptopyruvate sulfurtransferase